MYSVKGLRRANVVAEADGNVGETDVADWPRSLSECVRCDDRDDQTGRHEKPSVLVTRRSFLIVPTDMWL
jgi:hypothetical protein